MNINKTGYTDGTVTNNNEYNIIPSNRITMKGVKKHLVLIPIIGGKPNYDKKVLAKPDDDDIIFGDDVEGVLEIPHAQFDFGYIGKNAWYNSDLNSLHNPNNEINRSSLSPTMQNYAYGADFENKTSGIGVGVRNPNVNLNLPTTGSYIYPNSTDTVRSGVANSNKLNSFKEVFNDYSKRFNKTTDKIVGDVNSQMEEANQVTEELKNRGDNSTFTGVANPYGGWNMENSATMLGAAIQDRNALGIIGSGLKLGLSGLRNAFSGAGAIKRFRDSRAEYNDNLLEANRKMGRYYTAYQKGGRITNDEAKMLTGNAMIGNDDHSMPTAEVEKGEYLKTPNGDVLEVLGKKHSEGGEMISPPEGTKVISDYLKIGGKLAKYFKKYFNINVTPNSSFATVLDKFRKKIGLTELIDKEAVILKKVADQENVEFIPSREMNLQVLSKQLNDIQLQKQPLEDKLAEFTEIVFEKQENQKIRDVSKKYQEGGRVDGLNPEELINQFAQIQGVDPNDVIKQLQSLPPEKQEEAVRNMVQTVQGVAGGEEDNGQNGNQQVDSQQSQIEEIVTAYAQISGRDVNSILEQLSKMSQEQVQQALEQMVQVIEEHVGAMENGNNEQEEEPTEGEEPQEFQEGGQTEQDPIRQVIIAYSQLIGEDPNDVYKQIQGMDEESLKSSLEHMVNTIRRFNQEKETEEDEDNVQTFQDGGQYGYLKDNLYKAKLLDYIAKKIPQGKSVLGGGEVDNEVYNPGSKKSAERFLAGFKNVNSVFGGHDNHIKELEESLGASLDDKGRFDILNSDKGQKARQQYVINKLGQDVMSYIGNGYAPTQSKLQAVYDGLSGKDKKEYEEALKADGLSVQNGKVIPGGFYKANSKWDKDSKLHTFFDKLQENNSELYSKVGLLNANDGKWDRRLEDVHIAEFNSIEDRDKYLKEKGFKVFNGEDDQPIWVDPNDRNNVVLPMVYMDKRVKKEEMDKFNKFEDDGRQKGYKKIGVPGVRERWITDDEVKEKPDPLANIRDIGVNKSSAWYDGPLQVPNQDNLPPIYIPTSLREVKHVQSDRVFLSPEENLKELNKRFRFVQDRMAQANPYTSGAMSANLLAQTNDAGNKALAQVTLANQQDERRVNDANEARIQQRDNINAQMADKYEKESVLGQDNFYTSWLNYIDNKNRVNVQNWNLQNQVNATNAIMDNFKIASDGSVRQTSDKETFYVDNNGILRNGSTGVELTQEEKEKAIKKGKMKQLESQTVNALKKGVTVKKKGGIFSMVGKKK